MMDVKHTPTPWRVSETDKAAVFANDHSDASDVPYAVAFCEPCVPLNGAEDYGQYNAARIVLSVNAFDDLVAALKEARTELEAYELEATGETYNSLSLNAALAKATSPD